MKDFKSMATSMDLVEYLEHQREWSEKTFGPGERTAGLIDHIQKELKEIAEYPGDLYEWIDVMILAFDGARRVGYTPEEIAWGLINKQETNERRVWPDWKTCAEGKAIEHIKDKEEI